MCSVLFLRLALAVADQWELGLWVLLVPLPPLAQPLLRTELFLIPSGANVVVGNAFSSTLTQTISNGSLSVQNINPDFRNFADGIAQPAAQPSFVPSFGTMATSADFICLAQRFCGCHYRHHTCCYPEEFLTVAREHLCTIAPTSTPLNGNLLVVTMWTLQNSVTPTISVVDSVGQTWTQAVLKAPAGAQGGMAIYYILSASANPATLPNLLMMMGCGT